MTYNTTPITSGSAKFSTLDPDAPLFLEENNITVGANPENPATLYDYDTSTLHITNIDANNGQLNLNNSDLIGVKRIICQDFMGALFAEASDVLQETVILNSVRAGYTLKFRVPSNFIQGSSVKISYYFENSTSTTKTTTIYKYDPETETYTNVFSETTADSGWITSPAITVNAGELYCVYCPNYAYVSGDLGVKLLYNPTAASLSAVWEVITP